MRLTKQANLIRLALLTKLATCLLPTLPLNKSIITKQAEQFTASHYPDQISIPLFKHTRRE